MSERNPALWMQNLSTHTAEQERSFPTALLSSREGVFAPTDMAVTQNGTPNMSVNVAAGKCAVLGDTSAVQGLYIAWNDAAKNVTISAAHATLARKDLIVARIKDAFYTGASNTFTLEVITGTAAASPADPTLPDSCLLLARVAVGAAVTTIVTANITDLRVQTAAVGGEITCTSTTRPSAPWAGLRIFETDTNLAYRYDGTTWIQVGSVGAWTSWTPVLVQGVTPTVTTTNCHYTRLGRLVIVRFCVTTTSSGTSGSVITLTLPVLPKQVASITHIGQAYAIVSGGTQYGLNVALPPSSNTVQFIRQDTIPTNYFGVDPSVQMVSTSQVNGMLTYESAA